MRLRIEKVGENQAMFGYLAGSNFGIKFLIEREEDGFRARIFAATNQHIDMVTKFGADLLGGGIIRKLHKSDCEIKFDATSLVHDHRIQRCRPDNSAVAANPNIEEELLSTLKSLVAAELPNK